MNSPFLALLIVVALALQHIVVGKEWQKAPQAAEKVGNPAPKTPMVSRARDFPPMLQLVEFRAVNRLPDCTTIAWLLGGHLQSLCLRSSAICCFSPEAADSFRSRADALTTLQQTLNIQNEKLATQLRLLICPCFLQESFATCFEPAPQGPRAVSLKCALFHGTFGVHEIAQPAINPPILGFDRFGNAIFG